MRRTAVRPFTRTNALRGLVALSIVATVSACSPEAPNAEATAHETASAPAQSADPEATTQEKAAAPAQSEGVRADRFEISYQLDGTDLLLSIDTDLPDEGELSVTVDRVYYEKGNDSAYSRDYFSGFEPVANWREPRRISLDAETWKADLSAYQDKMAKLGADLAFEVDRIEPNVQVSAVLHLNQDAPQFGGRGNPKLTGTAVTERGNGKIVEAEVAIPYLLDGPAPTGGSRFVSHEALQAGSSYRLSGETPLMSEFEPSDPLAALGKTQQLSPGTSVRVTDVRQKAGMPWYKVQTSVGVTGWINSTALLHQQIERIQ
jgi:hypothetical protein